MTQVVIRNGVQRTLDSGYIVSAWDATVNKDNAWQTAGSSVSKYATWNEFEMSSTKNMITAYATTDIATQSQQFLPRFYQAQDIYSGYTLPYPLMDFNQEAAVRYAGSTDIFTDGAYNQRAYTAIMRFDNLASGKKAFILSIGTTSSIGSNPTWSYADLHVYRDSATNHDHIISRIGSSYKSSRITGCNFGDIHVYTLVYTGVYYQVYLDNQFITQHTPIATGGVWGASGLNWVDTINTMWVGGDVGYLQLSDTYTFNTGNYGVHAITHVKYNDPGSSSWPDGVNELCVYRYALPSPPVTSHNSTASSTLTSAEVIVFGSYNFGGTQQFL